MGQVGSFIADRAPRNLKDVIVGPASDDDLKLTKEGLESVGLKKARPAAIDPSNERDAAAAAAATQANARIAFQRRAQRENSLITGGGAAAAGAGRSTLGV
jgi:hypothetical protein